MDESHVRKRHVSLSTQQHRLRHLRGICARNISIEHIPEDCKEDFLVYFTVNKIHSNKVIYISETIENSLNPSWGLFEMSHFTDDTPGSTPAIQVKVWCRSKNKSENENDHLIIDWIIHFTGLHYIGEQIPKDGKRFTPNTIICYMLEGHYGSENCLGYSAKSKITGDYVMVEASNFRRSYNLSSVQRIHTVQRAMKQTKAGVQKEWQLIKKKLSDVEERKKMQADMELVKVQLRLLRDEVQKQEQRTNQMQETYQNISTSLNNQSIELENRIQKLKEHKEDLLMKQKSLVNTRESLIHSSSHVSLRWKQLVSELSIVYPIVQVPDKPFKICGVSLPNSEDFAAHQDVMISVALGYVAHLVLMISRFLNIPLRYPIKHFGSRSVIFDHISDKIPVKEQEFPLFCKGKDKIQFKYGVYLLNKNIAQLRYSMNLNTQDLRATLPNLYSLIELKLSMKGEKILMHQTSRLSLASTMGPNTIKNAENIENNSNSSDSNNRKYSDESKIKNIDPSTPNFVGETLQNAMASREISSLDQNSVVPSASTNMNNSLSYSLDQGLNKIQVSTSPDPRSRMTDPKIIRQMSSSHIDVNRQETREGFYKASFNMWKNVTSSDEDSTQRDEGRRKRKRDKKATSGLNNNSVPKPLSENGPSRNEINGGASETLEPDKSFAEIGKPMVELVENADDIDCDIVGRVEVLASRSGSFKQLMQQPSKKL